LRSDRWDRPSVDTIYRLEEMDVFRAPLPPDGTKNTIYAAHVKALPPHGGRAQTPHSEYQLLKQFFILLLMQTKPGNKSEVEILSWFWWNFDSLLSSPVQSKMQCLDYFCSTTWISSGCLQGWVHSKDGSSGFELLLPDWRCIKQFPLESLAHTDSLLLVLLTERWIWCLLKGPCGRSLHPVLRIDSSAYRIYSIYQVAPGRRSSVCPPVTLRNAIFVYRYHRFYRSCSIALVVAADSK